MATVQPVVTLVNDDVVLFKWTLTSANSDGAPIGPQHASFADRCVQVVVTAAGTSSNYQIQGSNDGTNYDTRCLNDAFGGNLTAIPNAGLDSIAEIPLYTRPLLGTAGSGATVIFYILCRRNRPGKSIGG